MSDNSKSKKKAFAVGVLVFLLCGGGVFLFLILQGSEGPVAGGGSGFSYGNAARGKAESFFKFMSFDDAESLYSGPPQERPRVDVLKEKGEPTGPAASASASASDWGAPSRSSQGRPSPAYIPRMSGGGGSGLDGGGGGGSSQSTGGSGRFGDGSDSGSTKVTGKSPSGGGAAAAKGTFSSLKNARAMLGDGLNSGSAMTAKGKWDSAFGVGNGENSKSGELAYGNTGLVKLDSIKKGEVDNIKVNNPKSLKIPEPGAFKEDKDAETKDPVLQKAKQAAVDAAKTSMASAVGQGLAGAVGQGASSAVKGATASGPASGPASSSDPAAASNPATASDPASGNVTQMESGDCDPNLMGPQTAACSGILDQQVPGDTSISYKQVATTSEGKVYDVSFKGAGTGITDQYKDQQVFYNDTARMVVKKDGTVTFSGWNNNEVSPMEIGD